MSPGPDQEVNSRLSDLEDALFGGETEQSDPDDWEDLPEEERERIKGAIDHVVSGQSETEPEQIREAADRFAQEMDGDAGEHELTPRELAILDPRATGGAQ